MISMKENDTYCRICTTGIALTSNGLQNRCRWNNQVIEISENVYQNKGLYLMFTFCKFKLILTRRKEISITIPGLTSINWLDKMYRIMELIITWFVIEMWNLKTSWPKLPTERREKPCTCVVRVKVHAKS